MHRCPRLPSARLASAALAVVLGLVAAGCGGDGGGEVPVDAAAVAAADLDRGADVYQARCAVCHGEDGTGGVGPELTGVAEELSVEEHLDVVWNGGGGMPRFEGQIDEEDLAAVVRYEREGW